MKKTTGSINISNTSQGTVSLNCSYREGDNLVTIYHDIPPARQCITGACIPIEDWNRVKDSHIVQALVDTKILLVEKKKVTIDQETWKTSIPVPTGELAEVSLDNLVKNKEPVTRVGTRKAKTRLNS